MTIVLLVLNIVLGIVFLAAGLMKLLRLREKLAESGMAWAGDFGATAVKAIGAAEVLGALGLVLPRITGIAPALAPIAAICLVILMIGAAVVHIRRHEPPVPPVALAVLSAVSAVLGFLAL
ncbi:MAG: DoxX family protein [Micrococcales bacterium]|nr:DoxX family protein [Micrococcales bacterium]